jgi:hypothetical protein
MAVQFIEKRDSLSEIRNLPGAAGIGAFNGGLFVNADGTPILVGGMPSGKTYFVDTIDGSASNDGRSWGSAFLTMAGAFDVLASGDTIYFRGKVREQLTAPVGVFDVSVIGIGTRPRHADTSPAGGSQSTSTWTTPSVEVAATPLVTVIQQGWLFYNILFAGPSAAASILLTRTAEGADETDASHASIIGCRFASGYDHISDTGGCYGVLVQGNRFVSATNFAILGVGNIGVGQSAWEIKDNHFDANVNGIKIAGFACDIHNNAFSDGETPATTVVLNTNNGGGANNRVSYNNFQTTTGNFNSPDVVGATTDYWNPNYSFDTLETGTPA